TPAQVRIVRVGVTRVPAPKRGQPFRRILEPKLAGDGLTEGSAKFALKSEHAARFAVIGCRPDLDLITRANQSCCNAQLFAFRAKRTFNQIGGIQFPADLGGCFCCPLVCHDRGAADYTEVRGINLPERRNHFLRKAICQILALRISTEIFERQNCKYGLLGRPFWRRFDDFNACDKAVSLARNRQYEAAVTAAVTQYTAQRRNILI